MSPSPLLSIQGLSVTRSRGRGSPVPILRDIHIEILRGSSVAVVGESGSGKSTLAKTVLGLIPAQAGSMVTWASGTREELVGRSRAAFVPLRRHLQMVLQDPSASFNPRRRLGESISEAARALVPTLSRTAAEERARGLWQEVGLEPSLFSRYPHEVSGGQKQRAALARALAPEPSLLVLDEATSALDQSLKAQIVNLLLELRRRRDLTLVSITHDLGIARALADRIVVLYDGRIVEDGPSAAVLDRPRHPYTAALAAALLPPVPALARAQLARKSGDLKAPSPIGCAFQSRCAHATEVCRTGEVPWLSQSPGHHTRCHREDWFS